MERFQDALDAHPAGGNYANSSSNSSNNVSTAFHEGIWHPRAKQRRHVCENQRTEATPTGWQAGIHLPEC